MLRPTSVKLALIISIFSITGSAHATKPGPPYDVECRAKTWNGSASGHKTCRVYDGAQMCGDCYALGAAPGSTSKPARPAKAKPGPKRGPERAAKAASAHPSL